MRILILEDDQETAKYLSAILEDVGYHCDAVHKCGDAFSLIVSSTGASKYDLLVVDIKLPDGDSIDMVVRLRLRGIKVPVIFISHLSSHDNKIKAFDFGGDDFIPKSQLHKGEFLARIRAVLRRCFGHHFSKFKLGNMVVDFHMQICKMNGKVVPLTNKEYSMLELLCMHGKGAIISKDKFISHLYSNNEPTEPKIIDVFACKLRSKLAAYNDGVSYLQTIWGRGYTLNESAGYIKDDKSSAVQGNSESVDDTTVNEAG